MSDRPRIAITMGDAAGIGPEIIVKVLAGPEASRDCVPVVLGDARVLERAQEMTDVRGPIRRIARPAEATGAAGVIEIIDYQNIDMATHRWGEVHPGHGAAAVRYTQEAGRLALASEVEAIVSAPLHKEAMHAAGYSYAGHTEILGELTQSRPLMMLLVDKMRLMLLTNHMALRAACDYLRADRVLACLVLADRALRDLGVTRPRLAVAGLNPHAGEAGLFGHEEEAHLVPAVAAARARGIDAEGPFPGDTVFLRAWEGAYDLTLALYHDQGLMAAKLLGFGRLVTLLVGLPIIRTSVGHGTAFDIAGTNRAQHGNLLAAIRVAAEVAVRRRGASTPGLAAGLALASAESLP
jgi:4-hydroxythreonine-4-phosphate dehydrogenase